MQNREPDVDFAIVGGGFYGCVLALFLRSVTERVVLIEAENGLLQRASRVNQARVHAGFHYPRSFVTALRSRLLQRRFIADFEEAIIADFDMLYAIAARRSMVTAARFGRMFQSMGAPIARASARHLGLFSQELVEDVFVCKEFAFNWAVLRNRLAERLDACGVKYKLGNRVRRFVPGADSTALELETGEIITSRYVLNVTYANINTLLAESGLKPVAVKHELAEIALIEPPPELAGCAITVMDGPFFSTMPYPADRLYSLTHVRYTPHKSWVSSGGSLPDYAVASREVSSRWKHMTMDAQRYVPCLSGLRYERSLFEFKTVLTKNERDDGRPIFVSRHQDAPSIISVVGAKIDNIYDLFEMLPLIDPALRNADARHLTSPIHNC